MNIRTVAFGNIVVLVIGAFIMLPLTGEVSYLVYLPLMALFVGAIVVHIRLRCPTCGKAVLNRWGAFQIPTVRFLQGDEGVRAFCPKRCLSCNTDLTEAEFDRRMLTNKWKPSNAQPVD